MTPSDEEQLRLLSRLHYVAAALASVISLLGAGYAALGMIIVLGKVPSPPPTSSHAVGWIPAVTGLFLVLFGFTAVGANLLTARALRNRTRHTLCLLTAAVNFSQFPLGTLLAAFTFVVLNRPTVRAAFEAKYEVVDPPLTVFPL